MTEPAPPKRRRPEIPFWLLAIALLGVLSLWRISASSDTATILRLLGGGVVPTLWVTAVAFTCATLLGLLVALMRTSRHRVLREVATFYIEIIRGIPMLVLLAYVVFVGAPALVDAANVLLTPLRDLGWVQEWTNRDFDLVWRAILALTVGYSAFLAEIFRAGIEAVDRGQIEAARALGLKPRQTFRHIVLPQAVRTVLPPLGNDFVAMIKDSALVSAVGVQDITMLGDMFAQSTFKYFETYNIVTFLYLSLTITLSLCVRLLERRLGRAER